MQIAVENLPDDLISLKEIVKDLLRDNQNKSLKIDFLQEQLRLFVLRRFQKKSERFIDPNQPSLFNEAEAELSKEPQSESNESDTEIEIKSHKRKARGKRVKLSPDLPKVRVEHDLSVEEKICPHHNIEMKRIGEEVSEQLDVIPATVQVLQNVRFKYACPCCDESPVKISPLPPQPIPKSNASPGLLAYIATSKYEDHLPLYRQEKIFSRFGAEIDRATMARWMIKISELCQPLLNLMLEDLLSGDILHCDETSVQVLKEPGRLAASKSYMWVLARGAPAKPLILYNYSPTRAAYVLEDLLADYHGFLNTDGYSSYESFASNRPHVKLVGCMAHARRKFWEAEKAGKKAGGSNLIATDGLVFIGGLYKIEREIKDASSEEKYLIRQEKSKIILEKFRSWLDQKMDEVPSSMLTGQAVAYANSEWEKLNRYLEDGRLHIDNNFCENKIRPFCLGRKNWMFSDTPKGAHASAAIYSLIETAKANDIEPFDYLSLIFAELPKAKTLADFEKLLAYNARENFGMINLN